MYIDMFVCFVLEGLARPINDQLQTFALISDYDRCLFIEALQKTVKEYTNFAEGFLILTVRTSSKQRRNTKLQLLRNFQPHINESIAQYVGVPYSTKLFYLYESIQFIETFFQ